MSETQTLFEEKGEADRWEYWWLTARAATGDTGSVIGELNRLEPTFLRRRARIPVLRKLAERSKNYQPLATFLHSSYEQTGNYTFRLESLQLRAQLNDWKYVAEHIPFLIEEVRTAQAAHMAILAAFNIGDYKLCADLLEGKEGWFLHSRLPVQLARVKVDALEQLGALPETVNEAEKLANAAPTNENLMKLTQLHAVSLDFEQAMVSARRLERVGDLAAQDLLRLAHICKHRDGDLARRFLQRLLDEDIPDSLVPDALMLTNALGVEEPQELIGRFSYLASQNQAGLWLMSSSEMRVVLDQQRQTASELNDAYERGTLPIHFVAEQLNLPLVELYHSRLSFNESQPDPARQTTLYVRHGSRDVVEELAPNSRIHLGVTALLLGEHLDIMGEVESTFGPLYMPQEVCRALIEMRTKVLDLQPRQVEAVEQVLDFIRRDRITVVAPEQLNDTTPELRDQLGNSWASLYEEAKAAGGYLLDWLPLRNFDGPINHFPEDGNDHLVNLRAVLEVLPLSQDRREEVLSLLGNTVEGEALYTQPVLGRPLYLNSNHAQVLAEANCLADVCNAFDTYLNTDTQLRLESELRQHRNRGETKAWLDRLIDRVRRGIRDGNYILLPQPPPGQIRDKIDRLGALESRGLALLMEHSFPENAVIWADDRRVTQWRSVKNTPIVGVNEVLKSLLSEGHLSERRYYRKLDQLRRGNVRFIPLDVNEVLYNLQQASLATNGTLIETAELTNLRRYVAAWLSRANLLQRPQVLQQSSRDNGELSYALQLNRDIDEVLIKIWTMEIERELRFAYSDWLMANVYVDLLGLRNAVGLQGPGQNDVQMAAIGLASLLAQGFEMLPGRRQDFFTWLKRRVIKARLKNHPELIPEIASSLKSIYSLDFDENVEALRELVWLYHNDLPEEIREEIERDEEFMDSIGAKISVMIGIDGINIDESAFWRAAAEVIAGTPTEVEVQNFGETVTLQRGSGYRLHFEHPETSDVVDIGDFSVLIDDPAARKRALEEHPDWFDAPSEVMSGAITEIANTETPSARSEKARRWRDNSPALYYAHFWENLNRSDSFHVTDLYPPEANRLLWHYRLNNKDEGLLTDLLEASAARLMDEVGLEETIVRLIRFPVPLPPSVVDAVESLETAKRRILILKLARMRGSLTSQIHLLRLLRNLQGESVGYRMLSRLLVQALIASDSNGEFGAFLTILRWSNIEIGYRRDIEALTPQLRLALVWSHAHQLFSSFKSVGADLQRIPVFFGSQGKISPELLARSQDYFFDIAHPHHLTWTSFVLCGISYGFGETVPQPFQPALTRVFEPPNTQVMIESCLDLNQASNCMGSFFTVACRETLISQIGGEHRSPSSSEELKAQLVEGLNEFRNDEFRSVGWLYVDLILKQFTPYADCVQDLADAILATDFTESLGQETLNGLTHLFAASKLVIHLGDQRVREYLRTQLLRSANVLAQGSEGLSAESAIGMISEAVFNLYASHEPSEENFVSVSSLLSELAAAWPELGKRVRPTVQFFCEDLPPSHAKHFWPLLIRLRTMT